MAKTTVALVVSLFCFANNAFSAGDQVVVVVPRLTRPADTTLEDEALQARYVKLWADHATAVGDATETIKKALSVQFEAATDAGNLALAEMWDATQSQLSRAGEIKWDGSSTAKKAWRQRFPQVPFPDAFTEALEKSLKKYEEANLHLAEGYNALVIALTKAKNISQARSLQNELTKLLAPQTPPPVPVPVSPIVGVWVGEGGWSKEFLADKTARNLTPKGDVDTIGTWEDKGGGQYSAKLAGWHWQIVLRGDEIDVVRYLNGELKGHGKNKRRR